MPPLRRETLRQRSRTPAASSVGIARDQAARDRIPAASAGVSGVWGNDLCGTALRRAPGSVGAATDGLHRASDGLLSPKQATHGRVPQYAAWPTLLSGADGEDRKPGDGGGAAIL